MTTQYYLTSGTELRWCEAMDKMINEALDRHDVPRVMCDLPQIEYTTLGRVILALEKGKQAGLTYKVEDDNDNQDQ